MVAPMNWEQMQQQYLRPGNDRADSRSRLPIQQKVQTKARVPITQASVVEPVQPITGPAIDYSGQMGQGENGVNMGAGPTGLIMGAQQEVQPTGADFAAFDPNNLQGINQTPTDIAGGTVPGGDKVDWLGGGAKVAQGIGSLMGAYTAYQGLGLAEDQVRDQHDLANANLGNAAALAGEQVGNQAWKRNRSGGGTEAESTAAANKAVNRVGLKKNLSGDSFKWS